MISFKRNCFLYENECLISETLKTYFPKKISTINTGFVFLKVSVLEKMITSCWKEMLSLDSPCRKNVLTLHPLSLLKEVVGQEQMENLSFPGFTISYLVTKPLFINSFNQSHSVSTGLYLATCKHIGNQQGTD